MGQRDRIAAVAEAVIEADPTRVWSLVANPERIADWAGFELVGYMGTELPKPGQSIFLSPQRRLHRGEPRRVEIEGWDAGARITCVVHTEPDRTGFELTIHPQVEPDSIATRIRLVQRSYVPIVLKIAAQRWLERRLMVKIDRIRKAVEE
jgi:hypothetical protein